jgi:hypothetical protein
MVPFAVIVCVVVVAKFTGPDNVLVTDAGLVKSPRQFRVLEPVIVKVPDKGFAKLKALVLAVDVMVTV